MGFIEPIGPRLKVTGMVRLSAFFVKPGGLMPILVKCKECGFLAVRNPITKKPVEATESLRNDGHGPSSGRVSRLPQLICWKTVLKFDESKLKTAADVVEKISEEIDCPAYVFWERGRHPREMETMAKEEALLDWKQRIETENARHRRWVICLMAAAVVLSAVSIIISAVK